MKRFNKKQIETIKKEWTAVEKAEKKYLKTISKIESKLKSKLGLDIIIFLTDGNAVGVGTYDRQYTLLHMPEGKYYEEL